MNPQHTEDYKQTAVKYYLEHNEDMRNTCEIFNCKFQCFVSFFFSVGVIVFRISYMLDPMSLKVSLV